MQLQQVGPDMRALSLLDVDDIPNFHPLDDLGKPWVLGSSPMGLTRTKSHPLSIVSIHNRERVFFVSEQRPRLCTIGRATNVSVVLYCWP